MAKREKLKARRHQLAALPWRQDAMGGLEIAIVQSRETRRWIVPKGWPMRKLSNRRAAEQEAFEEAGLHGDIADHPIGHYDYWKRQKAGLELVRVDVFPLKVTREAEDWPEKGQREMRWLPAVDAAEAVDDPGLKVLILQLEKHIASDTTAHLPAVEPAVPAP